MKQVHGILDPRVPTRSLSDKKALVREAIAAKSLAYERSMERVAERKAERAGERQLERVRKYEETQAERRARSTLQGSIDRVIARVRKGEPVSPRMVRLLQSITDDPRYTTERRVEALNAILTIGFGTPDYMPKTRK